jgi:tripartite-type tricarboxylate transporter receptor subunit TctC
MQVMFATLPSSIVYIKAGKLRALAVTTARQLRHCRTFAPKALAGSRLV